MRLPEGLKLTMTNSKIETALHPFTKVQCEVTHLQPGDIIDAGDMYRSATYGDDGMPIGPDRPGLGRWFQAGDIMHGFPTHPECNVHFMRLVPIVKPEPVVQVDA